MTPRTPSHRNHIGLTCGAPSARTVARWANKGRSSRSTCVSGGCTTPSHQNRSEIGLEGAQDAPAGVLRAGAGHGDLEVCLSVDGQALQVELVDLLGGPPLEQG